MKAVSQGRSPPCHQTQWDGNDSSDCQGLSITKALSRNQPDITTIDDCDSSSLLPRATGGLPVKPYTHNDDSTTCSPSPLVKSDDISGQWDQDKRGEENSKWPIIPALVDIVLTAAGQWDYSELLVTTLFSR
ncbi:hypothetical protein RRG08_041541 [Elysia crispata]|uniref:Uncharacterized protein n=1 Tax=Elysia crispata TaxID=231223 RepID=A0AAE1DNE2_9GAST|nr:hypothetical protein RRG08_041541 [Elysia crispata]